MEFVSLGAVVAMLRGVEVDHFPIQNGENENPGHSRLAGGKVSQKQSKAYPL